MSAIIKFFRARPSSKDRFHTLLRPHVELMYRMAYRWTQSQSDAEDLVQDVLARLAKRLDEMEQIEILRPWLIRVLYNRYVDLYRRDRNSPVTEQQDTWCPDTETDAISRAADGHDHIVQLEMQRELTGALKQLEEEQRDVVLLHDMEGYTAVEVADILQISVGTVKSRLHRARAKLKEILFGGDSSGTASEKTKSEKTKK